MELTARMRAILSVLLTTDGYVPAERIASALDVRHVLLRVRCTGSRWH